MNELKTSVVVDLAGNITRNAPKFAQSLGRFSQTGQRYLGRLGSVANSTGKALDKIGNRYTGLLTGAAGAGTGNMVINLERRFTRLGIQANISADEVKRLKQLIYDTSLAPDIRIDPSELTGAIEKIVEKTGDLEFARNNIRNIALAIQAAGASGNDIGAIIAEFKKLGIETEQGVLIALDTLVSQGKAGAFTLQNLASQGERAVSAFSAMGYEGQKGVQAMGALLQVARMGTSGPEAAATAYENMLKVIIEKGNELQSAGIDVFDPEKLAQGVEAFRPMPEILKQILEKSQGRATVLSKLFGSEGYRAITTAAAEMQKGQGFASLDKFLQIQGDGTLLLSDSARAANDAAGALENLKTVWQRFADESLTGPIQSLADGLNSISSETTGKILQGAVIAGGGAVIAGKAYKYGSKLFGRKGRQGIDAAMGAMGDVQRVYVVNMPGASVPGLPDAGFGSNSSKAIKGGRWAKFARYGSKAALPLAMLASGASLYDTWSSEASTGDKLVQTAGTAGGMAGGWGGAALGAAIGTAILPGIGTLIGGALGGIGGYIAGELTTTNIAKAIQNATAEPQKVHGGSQARRQQRMDGRLKIEVDDKRVTVRQVESNNLDMDVSGSSMVTG